MTYLINTRRLPEPAMVIAIEPQGEIRSAEAAELLRSRFRLVVAATHPGPHRRGPERRPRDLGGRA